jgi:DNA (cytosine-5)-methyltransferase 1
VPEHYYVEDFEDGTLTSSTGRIDRHPLVTHALTAEGHDASEDGTGRGTPLIAAPLSHGSNPNSNAAGRRREDDENLVAFGLNTNRGGNADMCLEEEGAPPVTGSHGNPGGVMLGQAVRRLTPTECCRLQGFPDDWLGTPNEKPDSPRYAALGDAVTVNVAHWVGTKIMEAHLKGAA